MINFHYILKWLVELKDLEDLIKATLPAPIVRKSRTTFESGSQMLVPLFPKFLKDTHHIPVSIIDVQDCSGNADMRFGT